MSKIGDFFKKVWKAVKKAFNKIDDAAKDFLPVVINVSEKLKDTVENGTFDTVAALVEAAIPGNADNVVIAKLKRYLETNLPKVICSLQLGNILAEFEVNDVDGQMKAILAAMASADDETNSNIYAAMASRLFDYLSDGEFTKAERRAFVDWYYMNYVKK